MDWERGFSSESAMIGEKEMEEFRSEKSVTVGKSPEEIEKLVVDESLSEVERTCLLISTGQDVQRVCVISHIPDLFRSDFTACHSQVLPKLECLLRSASAEVHVAASEAFATVIQKQLVEEYVFSSSLLPTVLTFIHDKDSTIASAWQETLVISLPYLSKDVIRKEVLCLVVTKGLLSQSVSSKKTSCKIVGRVSTKFEPFWVKRELLPLATTLCQDIDQDVRACMCCELYPLAEALGKDLASSLILPEVLELANDEECVVRTVAVETLAEVVPLLTHPEDLVPLLQKLYMEALQREDSFLPVMSKLLGKLCYLLKDVMSDEEKLWFLTCYQKMCLLSSQKGRCASAGGSGLRALSTLSLGPPHEAKMESECRRMCAYNFPAMLLFIGQEAFDEQLSTSFASLASDCDPLVRKTVASCFHEVVKLLDKSCLKVSSHYQNLLKDNSSEVLIGLIDHLPQVVEAFANASSDTKQPGLLELLPSIMACEQRTSAMTQWRLHAQLLSCLSYLAPLLPSDTLYSKIVPVLLKHVNRNCVLPVRLASGRSLCVCLRYLRKTEQREDVCGHIIDLAHVHNSPSRNRIFFIEMCHFLLDIFSRNFFKEHFYEPLLSLAQDPIVNVRLKLCGVLPQLKATLKLPGDRTLLQLLEQTVRRLISQEKDPDTVHAIRNAVLELDRTEVAMEMLSRRTFMEADFTDQRKEEEERQLALQEEREGGNGGKRIVPPKGSPCTTRSLKRASVGLGKKAPSPGVPHKTSLQLSSPSSPASSHKHSAAKLRTGIAPVVSSRKNVTLPLTPVSILGEKGGERASPESNSPEQSPVRSHAKTQSAKPVRHKSGHLPTAPKQSPGCSPLNQVSSGASCKPHASRLAASRSKEQVNHSPAQVRVQAMRIHKTSSKRT